MPNRRALVLGVGAAMIAQPTGSGATPPARPAAPPAPRPVQVAPERREQPGLSLEGRFVQGGHAIGRTTPRALVFVDGEAITTASAAGLFVIGFDRDAAPGVSIEVRPSDGPPIRDRLDIVPGRFPSTVVNGLPQATVEPSADDMAKIAREIEIKSEGFASRTDADDFRDGFTWPLETYRVSSAWGAQRVLNGTPARPHYGIDLAAPRGSAVYAPAAGRVTLAQADMHFEGGLILIDHGQGLITAYLHQSLLEVETGQQVMRGDRIGRVGMTGRATGPHLCWRMRWRNRNMDPSLMVRA